MDEKFFSRITRQILNKRPQLSDFIFNHASVYTGPIEIERSPTNFEVRVPANTVLVLAIPDNEGLRVLGAGVRLIDKLEWGNYQAYLVSQSTQTIHINGKKFTTADGWDITLSISISWRVQDARRIIKLLEPAFALEKMCLTAVTTIIQQHSHNDLIGITQPPMILADALARKISGQCIKVSHLHGMVIEQVSVCDICGDSRLVNPQLDACATKSALSTSLETIEMRTKAEQKEALARQQKAEIDRKTQIVENEGLAAALEVEFRRNLALQLASSLPAMLKNNGQGVGGTTMYAPPQSSVEIIETTLQGIQMFLQKPTTTLPQTIENLDSYSGFFKKSNTPADKP